MAHRALATAFALFAAARQCASQGEFSLTQQDPYNEGETCKLLQTGAELFSLRAQQRETSSELDTTDGQVEVEVDEHALFESMDADPDGNVSQEELVKATSEAADSDHSDAFPFGGGGGPIGGAVGKVGGAVGGATKKVGGPVGKIGGAVVGAASAALNAAIKVATGKVIANINKALVPVEMGINDTVAKALAFKNNLTSKVNASIQTRIAALQAAGGSLGAIQGAMNATLGAATALTAVMSGATGILKNAGVKGVDKWAPKVNATVAATVAQAQKVVDTMGNVTLLVQGLTNLSRPMVGNRLLAVNNTVEACLDAVAGFSTNFKAIFTVFQTGLMTSLKSLKVPPLVLGPINASFSAISNSTGRMASSLSNGITSAVKDVRFITAVPPGWEPTVSTSSEPEKGSATCRALPIFGLLVSAVVVFF